jgi:hypothetical protein
MTTNDCVICCESFINTNYNCSTCNNGICNNCYIQLVHRKEYSFIHNCPFCKTTNFKLCVDIDIPVIINFFEKNEDKFIKDITKLTLKINQKNDEIYRLKTIIENQKLEIKTNNELIDDQTNIINNTLLSYDIKLTSIVKKMSYQKFYKITYWNLRESNDDMTPQEAMKRVSVLWKQYKLSFL